MPRHIVKQATNKQFFFQAEAFRTYVTISAIYSKMPNYSISQDLKTIKKSFKLNTIKIKTKRKNEPKSMNDTHFTIIFIKFYCLKVLYTY